MGNLQQVVEALQGIGPQAVGVFHVQTAVFLDVKTLVFYFETDPSTVVGNAGHIGSRKPLVGDPGEGLGLFLNRFLADQSMNSVSASLRVGVGQIIGPAEALPGLIGQYS